MHFHLNYGNKEENLYLPIKKGRKSETFPPKMGFIQFFHLYDELPHNHRGKVTNGMP